MKILIRNLAGAVLSLEIEPDATVLAVKQQVQARWNLPVEQQKLIFAGKQLEEGRTLASYNIREGANLHVVSAKNNSFDDDLDIIDPNAFYRRLELLSDSVAKHSEFKRCGGQFARFDESTWTIDPAAPAGSSPTPPFEGVPDWMGVVFGEAAPEESSEQAVSTTDGVLASLWKTCLIFSRVTSSFRDLERQGFCNGSFNLLLNHSEDNVAELVRIPVVEIENIRQGAVSYLEAAFSEEDTDPDEDVQASLWAYILEPCKLLLERLNLPLELPDQSITAILIIGRVTALLHDRPT